MLLPVKHAALVLSASQALLALASPTNSFTLLDSSPYAGSDHSHNGELCSAGSLVAAPPPPEVHLDDAVFVGIEKGDTHHYLGIPFAQPP